jgi:LmeA-like phospholipid-binding
MERGGRLDRLDIVLTDVRLDVNDLRASGGRRLPPARRGTFEAELGEANIAEMTEMPGGVSVTLDNGVATIGAAGLEVDAKVEARDGDIVVSLAGPLEQALGGAEFPIDLSDAPGAPAVREVEIDNGALLLRGDLEEVRR